MGNHLSTYLGTAQEVPAACAKPLKEVEEDVDIEPLKVKVQFETSASIPSQRTIHEHDEGIDDKDDAEPEQLEDSSLDGKSQMQFMRVEVDIPTNISQHLVSPNYRSHVILVADYSGSMAGQPLKQVKEALTTIIGRSVNNPHVTVDVVLYNDKAQVLNYTSKDYESKIAALIASNGTSFVAAIQKVEDVQRRRACEEWSSTVVMFMTDGQDTSSKPNDVGDRLKQWKKLLPALKREVSVHAVGFGRDHDFKFMKELCKMGTCPGLFRYSEPSDGPSTLRTKVEELFDYAVYSARAPVDIEVTMDGENKILAPDAQQTHSVPGDIVVRKASKKAQAPEAAIENDSIVLAEMWVLAHDMERLPAPHFMAKRVVTAEGVRTTKRFPCVVSSVEKKVAEDADSRAVWSLRLLSRLTDMLTSQIVTALEEKKDVSQLQRKLTKLQSRLSNTQIFSKSIRKDTKQLMMDTIKEIQPKMDTLHDMMARYTRGETASVSILARAHDLRYEANFSKSRRQRMMNRRAVKNVSQAKADDAKLQNLTMDEAELSRLSKEAVEFFFCALSQESVVEVLRDLDSRENAIGFGLAVTRPEHIVDNPTSLALHLITGTLMSRSSMLDALEYKIDLEGHINAHNGFDFYSTSSFGHATVGMSREPINAWLPLYVTPTHWERVKMILKPSLGYLCTLDPLGFDWAQLDVLFMVLGAMISQLTDIAVGEHQLQLLFAYLRTCAACVEDFNLTDRFSNTVREFIREPRGRFKDKISNLHTLIGYIAALPVDKARKLLGYQDGDESCKEMPKALWYAMLSELLRRAGSSCFKNTSEKALKTLIDFLVHGRNWNGKMAGKVQEADCVADTTNTNTVTANNTTDITTTTTTNTSAATTTSAVGKVQEASCSATTSVPTPTGTSVSEADTSTSDKTCKASSSSETMGDNSSPTSAQQTSCSFVASSVSAARFTLLCNDVAGASDCSFDIEGLTEEGQEEGEKEDSVKARKAEKQRVAVEFERSTDLDRCMEIFARSHFNTLQSKKQAHAVSSSKKCALEWVNQGRCLAGLPSLDGTESEVKEEEEWYDCDDVDSSILEVTCKLLGRLSRRCFPQLYSLPGTLAFLHTWLSKDRCFSAMDSGLPPAEWIQEVKEAVAQIYASMNDHIEQCQQEVLSSGHDLEEVVIVELGNKDGGSVNKSDDEEYQYSDDDSAEASRVIKQRKDKQQRRVTLPMLLHVLDPSADKVKAVRAMLCQAVLYFNNSRAKDAASEGTFLDLKDKDAADSTLRNIHKHIVKTAMNIEKNAILWQRANFYLMNAPNIWVFLGYLLNTYTERDEGYGMLMEEILELKDGSAVPCLGDKVKVLLTGQWNNKPALAKGNSLMVGKAMAKNLSQVLGEETWTEIDVTLRSSLCIHVYRESDIPNRHGHCNSNPYIPPALRLKLGMPPI